MTEATRWTRRDDFCATVHTQRPSTHGGHWQGTDPGGEGADRRRVLSARRRPGRWRLGPPPDARHTRRGSRRAGARSAPPAAAAVGGSIRRRRPCAGGGPAAANGAARRTVASSTCATSRRPDRGATRAGAPGRPPCYAGRCGACAGSSRSTWSTRTTRCPRATRSAAQPGSAPLVVSVHGHDVQGSGVRRPGGCDDAAARPARARQQRRDRAALRRAGRARQPRRASRRRRPADARGAVRIARRS